MIGIVFVELAIQSLQVVLAKQLVEWHLVHPLEAVAAMERNDIALRVQRLGVDLLGKARQAGNRQVEAVGNQLLCDEARLPLMNAKLEAVYAR